MKKLACAIGVAGLIGTPAFAADMPVKAPYAPAPAVYNWTGWYVGVNAGASFGNVKTDSNVAPYTIFNLLTPTTDFITYPGVAGSDRTYPDGFMGGGQIGYNYQFSPIWVVGWEADFQGAVERDSSYLSTPLNQNSIAASPPGVFTQTATALTNYTTNIDWFGTVRLRAGYVWGNGNVFSYVTGGLAYGEVKINGTNTISGLLNSFPSSIAQSFGHSQVNTGWVVGYGTEGVIDFWGARNWTWKVEGLYMDLGHLDTTGVTTSASATGGCLNICGLSGGQVTTHSHFTDGILRAGLNYKFY
jgi:outer membrane immunogenic protein